MIAGVTYPDAITFVFGALLAIVGAVGVVTFKQPVHAALSLVMTLFSIAVLFIELGDDFLAAVQIIVYAGAIVVLFLFVIMLLGVDTPDMNTKEILKGQKILAVIATMFIFALFLTLLWGQWVTGAPQISGPAGTGSFGIINLSKSVFTTYLVPFEMTSALLVIAVVGAVILVRQRSGDYKETERKTS
jgi:NADH-quinone oxidoreductase subunit J